MAVRLVLVSHAATTATRQARFPADEPLGADIPPAAGDALRRIGRACSGPELRCRQTAAALGLDPVADPALADLDVGAWRGRTLPELQAAHPSDLHAWMSDPAAAPHGGESLTGLLTRVADWLSALPEDPVRIAAVTHPAVVRAAVLHALGAPPAGFWRLDCAPLSQTRLSRHGGRWRLRETGHPLVTNATDAGRAAAPGSSGG